VTARRHLEIAHARPGLDLERASCYAHGRARPRFRDMTEDDFDPVILLLDAVFTTSRSLKRGHESGAEKS